MSPAQSRKVNGERRWTHLPEILRPGGRHSTPHLSHSQPPIPDLRLNEGEYGAIRWQRTPEESGATNMFGAVPYLRREFPELSLHDTAEVMVEYLCIVAPPFAFTFLDTREPPGLHEAYHHSRKRS